MKLSLVVQKKMTQAAWTCGLFGAHRAQMRVAQEITRRPGSPVGVYEGIGALSDATAKLRWTEDPWQGKLDLVKHPTFLQEAMTSHPDYSGDCDDFANYWLAALHKNHLADRDKLYFAVALWEGGGHAVASYRDRDGYWWWAGNWNRCKPYPSNNEYDWITGISSRMGKPLWVAGRIRVSTVRADDTVIYGAATRCA